MTEAISIVSIGLILLVVGIGLPFVLLAKQGFEKESASVKRTHIRVWLLVLDLLKFTLIFFLIYPALGVFVYNYIALVVTKQITLNAFFQSFDVYSYLPILKFYANMGLELREFILGLFGNS